MPRLAKRLARHALETISVDGATRGPGAGYDSDPRLRQAVGSQVHPEMTPGTRRPGRDRFLVVLAAQQPRAARQPAARGQTVNRARPFARRERTTRRPPRVRFRTRNPWVRLRRVFDG
jgi:hypothetical protein